MSENEGQPGHKMLCFCLGVRYETVREAVVEHSCRSVKDVTQACKAGGGCRSCHPEIEEEIARVRAGMKRSSRGWLSRLFGR